MHATPFEQKLRTIVEPSLSAMGYVLLLVRLKESAKSRVLELVAERADEKGMTIDDCTDISHTVSALLDVADPITGAYQLEVSSPGLDRPLVSLADFEKFAGYEAKLETSLPVEGRKRFRGVLSGVKEHVIIIQVDGKNFALDFTNLRTAKLVLTDALVAAALKKQKK